MAKKKKKDKNKKSRFIQRLILHADSEYDPFVQFTKLHIPSIKFIEVHMPGMYQRYKDLVTPSEVSAEFHLFAFMTMIAASVGDKLYYVEGNDIVYLHIWTMFLGLSGAARKTTAINPVAKILAAMKTIKILASSGSPEGFREELRDADGVGFRKDSELGTLLGGLKRDYMKGATDEFCEIYDPTSVPLKRRLSSNKHAKEIRHCALTWLAATTMDSLNKCSGHAQIAGGFLPRWNIVFGGPPEALIPFRSAKPKEEFCKFVEDMLEMQPQDETECTFSIGAKRAYTKWYNENRMVGEEGFIGNFRIRILEVVKKYACLIGHVRHRSEVLQSDMVIAIRFGDYFLESAKRLVEQEISESQFEGDCQKILRAVGRLEEKKIKATQRELMRTTKLNKFDFSRIIDTMMERGDIVMNEDKTWSTEK